ncbi:monovalent cation:proton antiporter family protein [Salirhabdus sp. Marseille-P4669]|uniref:monovalent cation:proton antiporter family protein n=1 Tax=Salirhabdus sp. Marseille-P4669 TaxID=2042310 RepID=UPI000C797454|nr:monovalent cation:proton antiporter family protein [Salirhabdus sp. Marseille-P4669]
MEGHTSVTSLIIVLLAAFITPILLKKFKLTIIPVVVAEIIVGLIIGQSGFDLVEPDAWINILSTLGFIFLMFLSGVEIDFSLFKSKKSPKAQSNEKREPNGFLVSMIIFIFILIISYLISYALQLMGLVDNVFFMTLVISTISLGVVVPTLKEAEIMNTGIGQIILLVAVIADLVTMVMLAVFVSLHEEGGNMWLLLILFGAGVLLYFVARVFSKRPFFETLQTGTVQIETRAIFALLMILVGLSETLGAENILGAFLAGVLVSLLNPKKEIVKQLDSFGYGFLIPIFFVMVGVELNIWELFQHSSVFVLIPLLFIGLLLSKVIPALVLKKWYDWKTVMGAGFLLTSTLSLVVAAAKLGEEIGVIDTVMSSALILLAVVACIITPVLFKKIFPLQEVKVSKKTVHIVGANQLTLPLSKELDHEQYDVKLFHTSATNSDVDRSKFDIQLIDSFDKEVLEANNIFDCDILVATTNDDKRNFEISAYAQDIGLKHIVTRIESPEISKEAIDRKIHVVSTIFSSKAMLKAMVEAPHVADIFATTEEGLVEIEMKNRAFDGQQLRNFPFLGDSIIVRIFRDHESIVPHGDTELHLGDRLIVTGSPESIEELRETLRR